MDANAATQAAIDSGVEADVFSWWCNSGGGGVAGIAWLGTLCNSYGAGYNTDLNEKQWSAADSGFVSTYLSFLYFVCISIETEDKNSLLR